MNWRVKPQCERDGIFNLSSLFYAEYLEFIHNFQP